MEEKYWKDPKFVVEYSYIGCDDSDGAVVDYFDDSKIMKTEKVDNMQGAVVKVSIDPMVNKQFVDYVLAEIIDMILQNSHVNEMIEHLQKMSYLLKIKRELLTYELGDDHESFKEIDKIISANSKNSEK